MHLDNLIARQQKILENLLTLLCVRYIFNVRTIKGVFGWLRHKEDRKAITLRPNGYL
nr:MAG TPA: hypothetical protein [Caudoviricetes sp.]